MKVLLNVLNCQLLYIFNGKSPLNVGLIEFQSCLCYFCWNLWSSIYSLKRLKNFNLCQWCHIDISKGAKSNNVTKEKLVAHTDKRYRTTYSLVIFIFSYLLNLSIYLSIFIQSKVCILLSGLNLIALWSQNAFFFKLSSSRQLTLTDPT